MTTRWWSLVMMSGLLTGCVVRTGESARPARPARTTTSSSPNVATVDRSDTSSGASRARTTTTRSEPGGRTFTPARKIRDVSGTVWEKLGQGTANGANDRDVIAVGRDEGLFSTIRLHVEGSSVTIHDVVVTFTDGTTHSPTTRAAYTAGQTSAAIDLPGGRRAIRAVSFRYSDGKRGTGSAVVELWAR